MDLDRFRSFWVALARLHFSKYLLFTNDSLKLHTSGILESLCWYANDFYAGTFSNALYTPKFILGTSMKIVQFERHLTSLSSHVQNSSAPLTLYDQFQTDPPPFSLSK